MSTQRLDIVKGSISDLAYFGSITIVHFLKIHIKQRYFLEKKLKDLSKDKMVSIEKRNNILEALTIINQRIEKLGILMMEAPCKPPLVCCRGSKWFAIGEDVICFIENNFMLARVYDRHNYNNKTPMLTVIYDKQIKDEGFCLGYGGLYVLNSPHILKQWEYRYLQRHIEFTKMWARVSEFIYTSYFNQFKFMRSLLL